ncbi:cytochrome c oxidase subunit II [Halomicroarcula limicola]|uniref:Cytochrome c oxidase subunit II n=1 Tax=Haloarcula limicola TaxID=1429915 RepID=A0A8J7YCY3_9EURY|nr:cytochrome c oxidase subunit II [Halomicroarcula limicola]MBV0924203.1 cytochrome c oxidase subunit II [Halomicroarcula limicola]
MSYTIPHNVVGIPLHGGSVRAPADVFNSIFEVFLLLGTAVGILVVSYTLYHAIKYRETAGEDPYEGKVERPQMGELPTGGSGGRKVFYSFGISAIIVVSLIAWTYTTLLYIENGPSGPQVDALEIDVEGFRFGWEFTYPNGYRTNTLRVPQDRVVRLDVTSSDVFHNFGIPELRVKTDAVPGQTTQAWFTANQTGNYTAKCYELCGSGHSLMTAPVQVVSDEEYDAWYANTSNQTANGAESENGTQAESGTQTENGTATPTSGTATQTAARISSPAAFGGVPA